MKTDDNLIWYTNMTSKLTMQSMEEDYEENEDIALIDVGTLSIVQKIKLDDFLKTL